MKRFAFATALVAAVSAGWAANAATITISEDTTTVPLAAFNPTLTVVSGTMSIQTVSVLTPTALYRSPWEDTSGNPIAGYGNAYTSLQGDPTTVRWDAAIAGTDTLSLFWGSPDDYNFIKFFDSSDTQLGPTISLGSLSDPGLVPQRGHNLVTLLVSEAWAYVLLGTTTNAFEFANLTQSCSTCVDPPEETPIPGALPLFVGGLGLVAVLARRRKQAT